MRLRRLDSLMLETVLQLSQAGAAGTALDDRHQKSWQNWWTSPWSAAAITCSNHGSSSPSSIYSPGSHGCLLLKTCEGDCQPFAQKKHTRHSIKGILKKGELDTIGAAMGELLGEDSMAADRPTFLKIEPESIRSSNQLQHGFGPTACVASQHQL
ncbi:unnamed protein product [Sphagnum troendelagicum]|uniref:Uncharacterized protein n=1 Tax=Sphagnum troendelagicum TaxID=128251 RepID=A0ABP0TAE5_9BRYO